MNQQPANPARAPDENSPQDPSRDREQYAVGGQGVWSRRNPWVFFLLPLAVFMLIGTLEPTPDKPFQLLGFEIDYAAYPLVYAAKIALTMLAMALVWPGYRQFPGRASPLAFAVGVVGVVVWIGLCKLELEGPLLGALGIGDFGERSGFNPLAHWPDQPLAAYGFLALRLWGLAVVVPIIEEFFLRGLVMRFVIEPDWWTVPIGRLTPAAIAIGTLLPMAMHPAELLAAAVWFSMVTWLEWKTKNIWDCVLAHATTNLLLGVYVIVSGDWYFV